MKLDGVHRFGVGRERVWAALHDPEVLANAVPGLQRLDGSTSGEEYELTVRVGVGSVNGTYTGTFSFGEEEPPAACTVYASASGTPGSVDVRARMRLLEYGEPVECELGWEAEAKVRGPIAGVGQRLVAAAARRTTDEFLANVGREIAAPSGAATGAEDDGSAAPPADGTNAPAAEQAPAARRSFVPARVGAPAAPDTARVAAVSLVIGFLLALAGVAVGRWTARR